MTTERLYYDDSYTLEFDADVVEHTLYRERPALILNRSYFYPEGGGQPPDTGQLNGVRVLDVQTREGDRGVLHVLEKDLGDSHVEGQVDAARRLDHMQHHSGQHILSQALERSGKAPTVSVHMSADSMTIDVGRVNISPEEWLAIEDLANQVVLEDLPVRAWFPEPAELAALAANTLRKLPEVDGKVRIVDMGGFDVTACGGTHVSRTGEIGLIKIVRYERRGEATRLEFRCGGRSLSDYRVKNAVVNRLTADLTVGYWELSDAVARMRAENKALQSELKAAREQLAQAEAQSLLAIGVARGDYHVISKVFENRDVNEIRLLAQKITASPNTIVLFGIAGDKAQLLFGRSEGAAPDMSALLKKSLAVLKSDRGGGRPNFAQGGGVPASVGDVEAALHEAESNLG